MGSSDLRVQETLIVVGATGMLGSAIHNFAALRGKVKVVGTYRTGSLTRGLVQNSNANLVGLDNSSYVEETIGLIKSIKPIAVVNCVGVIKQKIESSEVLQTVPVNTILPHQLYAASVQAGSKFIQISTDCVFSGSKGGYTEDCKVDAVDVYGMSKYLGEIVGPNALTLRTSIIGHELSSNRSLLEWFLAQKKQVKGFEKAFFSGLPTNEVARVILEIVDEYPELSGLYHLASDKISKYDLLMKIRDVYRKDIDIKLDEQLKIDRSLSGDKLFMDIGYRSPTWDCLLEEMRDFRYECRQYFQQ